MTMTEVLNVYYQFLTLLLALVLLLSIIIIECPCIYDIMFYYLICGYFLLFLSLLLAKCQRSINFMFPFPLFPYSYILAFDRPKARATFCETYCTKFDFYCLNINLFLFFVIVTHIYDIKGLNETKATTTSSCWLVS